MLSSAASKDPEVLREVARLQGQEIERLRNKLRQVENELATVKGLSAEERQLRLVSLELQLAQRNKAMFGEKSEKRSSDKEREQSSEPTEIKGHGRTEQKQLKLIEQVHVLDEADKACPKCGGELAEWKDQFEDSEEIAHLVRQFLLIKHRRQKYRCQCGCIETALGPQKLMANGRYSIDFAVEVATSKYLEHAPLERQVATMAREGLTVNSQTLWDQLWALSRPLLATYQALHQHVLKAPVVFADETTWRLMSGKGDRKKHYVWTAACADAVYQEIFDSRSQVAAEKVLGGYQGVVMADGYKAYDAVSARAGPFKVAHCWAHVRRKFIDIEPAFVVPCGEVLELIGQLYAVERDLPSIFDSTTRQDLALKASRLKLRQEKSGAVVEAIRAWALATIPRCLPHSGLRQAIDYMFGLWTGLTMFVANAELPLDNNFAERAIRPVVVGRKNHYGSRSQRGLEVAAIFYSLLGSAKLAGVEPKTYLAKAARAGLTNASAVTLPWN